MRYCARPPLAQERLGRLNDDQLVYRLRKPTLDGRTELILTPLELLDRLAHLVTPPRIHKHRYCGVLAPNAALRAAVTASAGLDPPVIERILTRIEGIRFLAGPQGAQSLASLSRRRLISGHPALDSIFGMGSASASSK